MTGRLRSFFVCLIACLFGLLTAAGCEQPSSPPNGPATAVPAGFLPATTLADNWHETLNGELPAGLSSQVVGDGADSLLLFEIDPGRFDPVLLTSPRDGISALTALEENSAALVVGSGFVTEAHSLAPVGLLQHEGTVLNPVQVHGYTRILGINDDGIGVVHRKDYQRGLFHSAIQAGPGVVEAGELDISERDLKRPRYFRSFVAVCRDRWIAGVSLAPTHLRTLGELFLEHSKARSLGCSEVVNLAGDREAVVVTATSAQRIFAHGDPHTHKLSLIGFTAK